MSNGREERHQRDGGSDRTALLCVGGALGAGLLLLAGNALHRPMQVAAGLLLAGSALAGIAALRRARRERLSALARIDAQAGELAQVTTHLATLSADLDTAHRDLGQLDLAKDHFLSSISHELRTPLTSIIAATEILKQHADGDPLTRAEFLEIVQKEASRLLGLIGNILDYTKLKAGTLQLDLRDQDLREMLDPLLLELSTRMRDKGVLLCYERAGAAMPCHCDANRIQQLVRNILDDSLRASPPGGLVRITFAPGEDQTEIRVTDQGPAVDEFEDLAVTAFLDGGRGAGLGLAIGARLADLHGGSLVCDAAGGDGFAYVLRLPTLRTAALNARA